MAPSLTEQQLTQLTADQLTQVLNTTSANQTTLNVFVSKRLKEVDELADVKKELALHRKIETTRREMDDQLAELTGKIKGLEEEREAKRVDYEDRIKNLRLVQTLLRESHHSELIFHFRNWINCGHKTNVN